MYITIYWVATKPGILEKPGILRSSLKKLGKTWNFKQFLHVK